MMTILFLYVKGALNHLFDDCRMHRANNLHVCVRSNLGRFRLGPQLEGRHVQGPVWMRLASRRTFENFPSLQAEPTELTREQIERGPRESAGHGQPRCDIPIAIVCTPSDWIKGKFSLLLGDPSNLSPPILTPLLLHYLANGDVILSRMLLFYSRLYRLFFSRRPCTPLSGLLCGLISLKEAMWEGVFRLRRWRQRCLDMRPRRLN